jgi:hypothetical protein
MKRLLLLLLFCTTAAFAQEAPAPPAPSSTPRPSVAGQETQLFQVVLLRASRQGPESVDDVPKSARKALDDIREFLPFKRYQLVDSGLMRLVSGLQGRIVLSSYEVAMSFEEKDRKLAIWFFSVYPVKPKGTQPLPPGHAPEAVKPLISTSFSIERGETVVVGSSKINGDEALVVLLTAVPSK